MSRGGRGGGFQGGRRGGSGFGGGGGFGGDPDLKPDYSVTELFPPQTTPVPSLLSREERMVIARFRDHREKIRNGPMYTVLAKKGLVDPFNDITKYSRRYQKQKRRVPKLNSRPYVVEFFPKELHMTLGVAKGEEKQEKKLVFSALDVLDRLNEIPDDDEDAEDGADGGDDDNPNKRLEDDDEMGEEEEEEGDELLDDDEGDYNAEQYFEDGEDDYADGGGGGDEDWF